MIELKNVSFSYPGQARGGLSGVNLTVRDGECVLLCGRSGCGKTTVTRLVNGLIPRFYTGQMSGTVCVGGENIDNLPMYQLSKRVGSVFQNPRTQFFNTDSDSEIAFGLENAGCPPGVLRQRVEQVSRDLSLGSLRGRALHALSGGEKQRIAFASVYAVNPDVYLLDEPSSNLDMDAIRDLKAQLKLVKAQGKTILIAEHRLYYLMDIADRIVYLEEGQIAGIYTPKEIRALPPKQREAMGLRATDLGQVHPVAVQSAAAPPLLLVQELGMFYKKKPVAEGISLSAGRGEVIGIVGHNGAGKTTLARSLCGLHKGVSGGFYWKGQPQERKDRLRRSYMVMQDVNYELFAESVEAECAFGIRRPDPVLVRQTMDRLGLTPYRECHPNTLSGGQKQRVAVAVSMVCQKELLVFDEPTSGLDFDSMAQVAGLVRKLAAGGRIIFIVTHDYEFVCRTCSRVFHIDQGKPCADLPVAPETETRLSELFAISERSDHLCKSNKTLSGSC